MKEEKPIENTQDRRNNDKYLFHAQTYHHYHFVFAKTTVAIQLYSKAVFSCHFHATPHHGMMHSIKACHPLLIVACVVTPSAPVKQEWPDVHSVLAVIASPAVGPVALVQ